MRPLRVGDILYGYCEGYFDDSYEDKRVEAIGVDWVVVRDEDGHVMMFKGDPESLMKHTGHGELV